MDTKYSYILLLLLIITASLTHGRTLRHTDNPAAEIGRFVTGIMKRFSVNIKNTPKHTYTDILFTITFFSPYSQRILSETSERMSKMSLEELCEITYNPENCCDISYNPEYC